jgi:hypothetical protein
MTCRNEIETRVLPVTEDAMAEAVRILSGELLAFPTDTVYGVGAHAFQPQAVEKINAEARRDGRRGKDFRVSAIQRLTAQPPHYLALCQPQIDALSFFASVWLRMALNGRLSTQGRKSLKPEAGP